MLKYSVYPQPIGDLGLSRVDIRDIAEAAAIALTKPGHEGQTYNVVGPQVHTGKSTAEVWSRALGKTIAYGGNDLDAWEQQSSSSCPHGWRSTSDLCTRFSRTKALRPPRLT